MTGKKSPNEVVPQAGEVPARRAPAPLRRRGAARVIAESARERGEVIEHPDGWYWLAPDGREQFGPFATRADACADRDRAGEDAPVEGETLGEAEAEIGIADWIDPETGEPAEGQGTPHLPEGR